MHNDKTIFFIGVGLILLLVLGAAFYGYASGLWDIWE